MSIVAREDPSNLIEFYRSLLAANPTQPAIAGALARVVLDSGDPATALDVVLAVGETDDLALVLVRAQALKALCRFEPAAESFAAVAASGAAGAGVLSALGICLAEAGRLEEAASWFAKAAGAEPSALALANLGAVQARLGRETEAIAACHAALDRDPGLIDAHRTLAVLLEGSEPDQAARHRGAAFGRRQVFLHDAPPGAFRVLVLTCIAGASLPIQHLLPKSRYRLIEWFIDHAAASEPALPPHDVVFNAIGEADLMPPVASTVARVLEAGRPVFNPPAAVARTGRAALPDLLAGIEGVVVPPVVRCTALLPPEGIAFPLLIRPIGSHGGQGLCRVETEQALEQAARSYCEVHVSGFIDYRSADGFYRKYRMIFVDRIAYPYHLAIGPDWMVHYWTAGMETDPARRAEEARFLADPAGAIGHPALAAISAIARRLDLDYAGIDFSLLPDGRVLVFEANAAMLVHPEHDPVLAYRNPHVQRILDAFADMLCGAERLPCPIS